jgi:23S rRNA pseudouridine2605 synthase
MHPRFRLEKEYEVVTPVRPSPDRLARLQDGLTIEGRPVSPSQVRLLRETQDGYVVRVILHQGMNHVVRKMMDAVAIPVSSLRRTRIGPLSLAGIPTGMYRDARLGEIASLREAIGAAAQAKPTSNRSRGGRDTKGNRS